MNSTPAQSDHKSPLPSETSPFSQDEYNEVVTAAELVGVSLKKVRFDFDELAFYSSEKEKSKRRNTLDNSTIRTFYDAESGVGQAEFSWSVEIRFSRKRIFYAQATYGILYDGMTGLKEDAVRSFLRRVGKIAVYPYFRALVSHFASDAGINLPVLPVFKIQKPAAPRGSAQS